MSQSVANWRNKNIAPYLVRDNLFTFFDQLQRWSIFYQAGCDDGGFGCVGSSGSGVDGEKQKNQHNHY